MSNQPKPIQFSYEEAYKSFWAGLKELDLRGSVVPCNILLNGEQSFPLLMNSHGETLIAASLFGQGRIVAVSHEEYLKSFPVLVEKALIWLKGGESGKATVGVHKALKAVINDLNESKFQVSVVEAFDKSLGVGVYVTDACGVEANPQEVVAFLKSGGGVLIAGQPWDWEKKNPGKTTIFEFPGNKVSGVAGIYFTGQHGHVENIPLPPEIPTSWTSIQVGKDFKDELDVLLKGISGFGPQGDFTPSQVLVHGSLAFPIGVTEDEFVYLAGGYYGLGRVIVVSHEVFMNTEILSSFWKNAIQWLDQGRNGVIGFKPGSIIWKNLDFKCEQTMFRPDLSVYVCKAYRDHHAEEIQNFVAEGGGLIIGGQAHGFASNNPELNPMQDFPGNKILKNTGLSILKSRIQKSYLKCAEPIQASQSHFRRLLQRLAEGNKDEPFSKQEEELLLKGCKHFLQMKTESFYYKQVVQFLTAILIKFGVPQVSKTNPVKTSREGIFLDLASKVFNVTSNQDALLPHLITDTPSYPMIENQKIKVTANTKGYTTWISTGLYLPPGMKTLVTMPSKLVSKRWKIQIGCQSDVLKPKKLKKVPSICKDLTETSEDKKEYSKWWLARAPSVCETFIPTSEVTEVWNLWGGLIYIVAPHNAEANEEEVIVKTSVSAPYYKSGATTLDDWSKLREAPAPWAEFEFDNIILTVPSHVVRGLERPDEVEKIWNDVMKAVADLAVKPHTFERKERAVADVQILMGALHSGYPIMMHIPDSPGLFQTEKLKTNGIWGMFHELGHNQQRDCWEFRPHTTEATCNLWSVYINEEVLGINRAKVCWSLPMEKRKLRIENFVRGGRSLSDWKVFTCLETYLQLQEKFGWDAFKKVFAAYHDMTSYPKENNEKMNLYAQTFSQTVQMNLSDFFKAWGWPIEKATEEKLSNLPSWTDHPMTAYT